MRKNIFIIAYLLLVGTTLLSCKPRRIIEASPVFEDPKSLPDDPGLSAAYLKVVEGATHDFGNVNIAVTEEVTLTLLNDGVKDADNIAVATNLAAPFAFKGAGYPGTGGTCGSDLASGNSCDIVLTFTPSAGGTFSGSFVLDYESEGDPLEFSFGVRGSSGEADITTDYDPTLTFDNTLIGSSTDVTVTLSNGGDLTARFLTDAGAMSAPFSYKGGAYPGTGGTCAVELVAGDDCTVVLTYTPTVVGSHIGAWGVGFVTGGSAGSAALVLNGSSGIAVLEITDFPLYTYAATFIGDTTDRTFTISNTGNFAATDVSDAFALAAPYDFVGGSYPGTGGTCTDEIDAGDDCTIVVRFEPTEIGTFTDTLEIDYDNGEGSETLELDLSGLGRGAILEATTGTTYNFGRLAKGTSDERTITIQNVGNYAATSVNDALAPAAPFYFKGYAFPGTGGSCGSVLSAGASCTLVFQYAPTGTGTALVTSSDTVEIDYNDGTNTQTLELTLEGEAGLGSLSFGSTAWGNRVVGTASNRSVTVTNNGTFAVTNIAEGANAIDAPFSWLTTGSFPGSGGTCSGVTLAPAASCTLRMDWTPLAVGAVSDTVDIEYFDGANTQSSTRSLTGTGVLAVLTVSVATYDYGNVSYNDTFGSQVFTITNTGGNQATAFTRSGLNAPFSIQSQTCGATLNAGASCTVTVRFTPTALGAASDTLEISYNDGQAVQAETIDLDGTGVNTAPVASDDAESVPQDDPGQVITLGATDANGNALTYSIVGGPSNGALGAVVGNTVTYTPNPTYNGPDSFTFRAHDGTDFSNTATVTITVTP